MFGFKSNSKTALLKKEVFMKIIPDFIERKSQLRVLNMQTHIFELRAVLTQNTSSKVCLHTTISISSSRPNSEIDSIYVSA